jgi:hypothetical protein
MIMTDQVRMQPASVAQPEPECGEHRVLPPTRHRPFFIPPSPVAALPRRTTTAPTSRA